MLRNCLIILLIALLPIRSWASERMGIQMAQPSHSMQSMADGDDNHCEMMQSEPNNPNSQSEHHDKPSCQVCSMCMAFAFIQPSISININHYSYQLAVRKILLIDSASLALPIKPPIS
jgi:hypothetical protein